MANSRSKENTSYALPNEGKNRRRVLWGISSTIGGVSVAGMATPFVSSLRPSRKAQAAGAPVSVFLKDITAGSLRITVWRQKPVWILHRNEDMIARMNEQTSELIDPESESSNQPEYCKNTTRSIKPEYFVAVGLCTHLGCSPGREKGQGFLCACHGSRFDFAGRVFKGSPAPKNLIIPPHYYDDGGNIIIGIDKTA